MTRSRRALGPPTVELHDETMREGMQIESVDIPIATKVRLLDALSQTGLRSISVGSFVSPRYTPQMAQIDEVVALMTPRAGVTYDALALNEVGRQRLAAHVPPLTWPSRPPLTTCHLCDTFVRRNANRTQRDEIDQWDDVVGRAVSAGATEAAIGLGAAWGSNFAGRFELDQRMATLADQHARWTAAGIPVALVSFTDPMSWCMPDVVEEQLQAIVDRWPSIRQVHLHLHNARGMALPCVYAALRVLDDRHVLRLDTTVGGIGGCPSCGNGRATGMAATEDVVAMLEAMDIDTGVDLDRLITVAWMLEEILGRTTPSFVSKAGPMPSKDRLYDPDLPLVETHEEAQQFFLGPQVLDRARRPWRRPIPAPLRQCRGGEAAPLTDPSQRDDQSST